MEPVSPCQDQDPPVVSPIDAPVRRTSPFSRLIRPACECAPFIKPPSLSCVTA